MSINNLAIKKLVYCVALSLSCTTLVAAKTQNTKNLEPTPEYADAAYLSARILNSVHYKAEPLNDKLSVKIFDSYLELLDPSRQFFTQEDIHRLTRARTHLDDSIRDKDLYPAYLIYNFYQRRTDEYFDYASKALEAGFDFSKNESFEYDRSKAAWPKSKQEMQELWRKRVKNDWLLLKLAGKDDAYIRDRLKKRYDNSRSQVFKSTSEDVFQLFMNAYSTSIDPHTNYLAPRTMDNFNISMKLSLVGIGATLQLRDDYTTVRELIAGGPAARSKRLNPGDRIVGVAQGEKGAMTDVIGWRLDDVVDLIRGDKGTTVVLDVLPANAGNSGQHKRVVLVRDKIKLEEQAAKKSIIEVKQNDKTIKVGIITLPSFYRDFDAYAARDDNFRSASKDVLKLINELKKENVSGIVMDLRNNGGGALNEAVEVTGLFIKQGPVVQQRVASGNISVESDEDPSVAWDGPLAVMINRASASASEILAAAIQDYGRGLVIGETSYGKGTVQTMIDLDQVARNDKPVFGELKLTTAQFFRVNGGTTQLRGVVPDIQLPTLTDLDEFGESSNPNALPWTQIKAANYRSEGYIARFIPQLQQKHQARIAQDPEFVYLNEDIRELKAKRAIRTISLNYEARVKERKEREAKLKKRPRTDGVLHNYEEFQDDGLLSNERDLQNELSREKAQENIKDIFINEAANILVDGMGMLGVVASNAGRK